MLRAASCDATSWLEPLGVHTLCRPTPSGQPTSAPGVNLNLREQKPHWQWHPGAEQQEPPAYRGLRGLCSGSSQPGRGWYSEWLGHPHRGHILLSSQQVKSQQPGQMATAPAKWAVTLLGITGPWRRFLPLIIIKKKKKDLLAKQMGLCRSEKILYGKGNGQWSEKATDRMGENLTLHKK